MRGNSITYRYKRPPVAKAGRDRKGDHQTPCSVCLPLSSAGRPSSVYGSRSRGGMGYRAGPARRVDELVQTMGLPHASLRRCFCSA